MEINYDSFKVVLLTDKAIIFVSIFMYRKKGDIMNHFTFIWMRTKRKVHTPHNFENNFFENSGMIS